jgi:diaminopimelate dehydrogenase
MTRIGIYGYGNLGRGVEAAINQNDDMELVAVFTRRNPDELVIKNQTAKVCNVKDMADWKDKIDVMILCGGSATDLPEQTPECAKYFNVIDSFDTHARIPEHFANVDASAKASGHIGIISVGWDPGMFSLNRLYGNALLPEGNEPDGSPEQCRGLEPECCQCHRDFRIAPGRQVTAESRHLST